MNEILQEDTAPPSYLKVKRFQLQSTNPATMETVTHSQECLMRGDSVAVLSYRPSDKKFVWIEQFRIGPGTKEPNRPTTVEPVAGMIDGEEPPMLAARREAGEEAGVKILTIEPIFSFFMCPGVTNERMHLFFATIDDTPIQKMGGLVEENEFIQIHVWDAQETQAAIDAGRMNTAQSMLLWQWAQLKGLAPMPSAAITADCTM